MPRIRFQKTVLTVMFYREGDKFIAFSPALKLSTCGDTEDQAKRRFEEMQTLFFEEIDKMGTFEEVLTECGWKKSRALNNRCWQPPQFIGQTQQEVRIPCPA